MNKNSFKKYMKQGLGKCFLTLTIDKNINKYKDIVLWGCLNNLSYDNQCEGTRSDYVYNLLKIYNDEEYFVNPIIEKFNKVSYINDHLFSHLSELVRNFAMDGNEKAKIALESK